MLFRSIGFRLALGVGIALTVGLLVHLYVTMAHHESALVNLKREEATLLADAIEDSLTHAMQQGVAGRNAIRQAIAELSSREEIERVRIFNAVGLIQYSSDPAEMGRVVDKEAENCKQCHETEPPLRPEHITDRSRFFYTPQPEGLRHRVMGVINPIRNDPDRRCTDCHEDQSVLGVLDVVVTLESLDRDLAIHRSALWVFGSLAVLLMFLVVGFLTHVLVHRPVAELLDGTRKVGKLELDYRIPTERKDELGNLAAAFNEMTGRLKRARERIREFTDSLEQKVAEKTEELQATQAQMLRTEKMAAIGQMAAGVAHEINNPLTGVITFASLLKRKVEPGSQESADLDTIVSEARRCSKIARGLLDFARGGELVRSTVDLGEVLDRTLALVENQALFHNIEIRRDYSPDLPPLSLDQDRMQQVFLNLVINAAEAMGGEGRLALTARGEGEEFVRVEIADTGPGIPDEIKGRIFDPFFTTKETGQGTGLGLSVTYRIVDDHGGRIEVVSEPGKGTTFVVILPVSRAEGTG